MLLYYYYCVIDTQPFYMRFFLFHNTDVIITGKVFLGECNNDLFF